MHTHRKYWNATAIQAAGVILYLTQPTEWTSNFDVPLCSGDHGYETEGTEPCKESKASCLLFNAPGKACLTQIHRMS